MTRRYIATVYGASADDCHIGCATIREARTWAECFGATVDQCEITDSKGRVVGRHVRDRNGNGRRWYRAAL